MSIRKLGPKRKAIRKAKAQAKSDTAFAKDIGRVSSKKEGRKLYRSLKERAVAEVKGKRTKARKAADRAAKKDTRQEERITKLQSSKSPRKMRKGIKKAMKKEGYKKGGAVDPGKKEMRSRLKKIKTAHKSRIKSTMSGKDKRTAMSNMRGYKRAAMKKARKK